MVAAQFLLDSEANLAAGLSRLQDDDTTPVTKAPVALTPDPHANH